MVFWVFIFSFFFMGVFFVLIDVRVGGEGGGFNFFVLWGLSRFGEMEVYFLREFV